MSGAIVTIQGRLTADPVLRTTNGQNLSVANFTVAHTPRRFNEQERQWEDAGATLFVEVTAWRDLADNAASSLHKGDAVVVTGELGVRPWETKEGQPRKDITCKAETIAADLRWATAVLTRFSPTAANARPAEPGEDGWAERDAVVTRISGAA